MRDLKKKLLEVQALLGTIVGAGVVDHARLERARALLRRLVEEDQEEGCDGSGFFWWQKTGKAIQECPGCIACEEPNIPWEEVKERLKLCGKCGSSLSIISKCPHCDAIPVESCS